MTLTTSPNDFELGPLLRKARQNKGMSLAQFEEFTNGDIKAVVMGSYERGDRQPTFKRVMEIFEYLGIRALIFSNDGVIYVDVKSRIF